MVIYNLLEYPSRLYIKQCTHCGLKYFGKSTSSNIEAYDGSGKRWLRHIRKHKIKPVTLWVSDWYYDTSIKKFALKFSRINKIVEENIWANLVEEDGLNGGNNTMAPGWNDGKKKLKETINAPEWKDTIGKEKSKKQSKTLNSKAWRTTVGENKKKKLIKQNKNKVWKKEKAEKQRETKSSAIWKETVGKNSVVKQKETKKSKRWKDTKGRKSIEKKKNTMSDPEWQLTVGKRWKENISKCFSDPEWQATVGKDRSKKISENTSKFMNDPEWKKNHYKTCPHCDRYVSPAVYGRLHGEKCKNSPIYNRK